MSDLFKFIIQNIGKLKPLDYLLLTFVSFFLGTGIFAVFRWLFVSRFNAQSDLIDLKDKMITTLQAHLSLNEAASKKAEMEKAELTSRLSEIDVNYSREMIKAESYTESIGDLLGYAFNTQRALLVASLFLLAHSRVSQVYRLLYLYICFSLEDRFPNAPSSTTVARRLEKIAQQLTEADTAFDIYFSFDGIDTSLKLDALSLKESIAPDSLFQEIRELQDELMPSLDHLLELIRKKKSELVNS